VADDPGPIPERRPRRRRTTKAVPPVGDVQALDGVQPELTRESEPVLEPEPAAAPEQTVLEPEPAAAPEPEVVDAPAVVSAAHDSFLPMMDDRSPNEWVCPFLRAVDDDGRMLAPVEAPDADNRCAALREPVPQSLRQQELVCLTSGHVNCPRYLRGAVAVTETPPAAVRTGRVVSPAILGSAAVLALAFVASMTFVIARGGLELSAAATPTPRATEIAVVATASPSVAPSPTPTPVPTPSPSPTPTPSPSPTPTPVPTPTPTPTPTPEPTPKPTARPTAKPKPTSSRYALLKPCPSTPNCWIYTVRSGDNLYSIANYFGVSLQSIYDRNPWTRTTPLRAGQELRLPPPTR